MGASRSGRRGQHTGGAPFPATWTKCPHHAGHAYGTAAICLYNAQQCNLQCTPQELAISAHRHPSDITSASAANRDTAPQKITITANLFWGALDKIIACKIQYPPRWRALGPRLWPPPPPPPPRGLPCTAPPAPPPRQPARRRPASPADPAHQGGRRSARAEPGRVFPNGHVAGVPHQFLAHRMVAARTTLYEMVIPKLAAADTDS